ncbi:opsin 7, group member c [Myxocyprinus asiaticus]|uniref:opsin 7, group member c n=1 Tax=Myxocyprinus asiaticus TaxID=70543 RepID=UPI002223B08A|nr:opsin 7, group member c [Myxocyprinus asiaticus]
MSNVSKTALFVSTISRQHDVLMGSLYLVFCVLSLLGNGMLLFVAYRKRSSLKPAEFFIVNLSVSDLGMTHSLFPLAIPSAFAHRWLFGEVACLCYAMCGVLFGLCSLTNLTALSSVCCLKVCLPNYGNKFSSSHARVMVVAVWCYAFVFAVGPLLHWGSFGPEPYGTACCINWYTPFHDPLAMSYIISLFIFCYVLPCTIIILSYTFILLTVKGSRQAVQQHISPQTKVANAHVLIVKLSVAVCIGFLTAWSPYAVVAMWAAFSADEQVPPTAFALAAILAKSSTIYNPMVYLLFKPNFRKSLSQDTQNIYHRICLSHSKGSPRMKDGQMQDSQTCNYKDASNSTHFIRGQPESYGACLHYTEAEPHFQPICPQRTARILEGAIQSEIPVRRMSERMQNNIL